MKIIIDMPEIKVSDLADDDALLVKEARDATESAFAPYSGFHVGAALLLANGEVVRGGNQENVSYPVGICAERTALATAQNTFPGVPVQAIALAARDSDGNFTADYVTPCGMCRQAIAEVERRYKQPVRVIMTSAEKALIARSISDILPVAF